MMPAARSTVPGRFKLDAYVPNDHVALSRNEKYWDSKYPYLDAITLKVLPDRSPGWQR